MKFKTKYILKSAFVLWQTIIICTIAFCLTNCNSNKTPPPKTEIVEQPQQMAEKVPDIIQKIINQVADKNKMDDSIAMLQPASLQFLYDKNNYTAKWSKEQQWLPLSDSLINFLQSAKLYGLFPEDYHLQNISAIQQKFSDSSNRKDAVLWSKADILLTDALLQIINHLKLGRLGKDSISLRTDSALTNQFYQQQFQKIFETNSLTPVLDSLEPKMKAYQDLKAGHNRGTAVDLTIINLKTGKELNMGTGFDNFSDTAHQTFTNLPEEILQNRLLLKSTMEKYGFVALATEWWHFYWKEADKFELLDVDFKKLERNK